MVQSSGSQRLVESQNAAISPWGSTTVSIGAGVDGAAGAEAGGDDPGAGVAGADGAHHVVAAARR
jgi:hypothetical protein